MELNAATARLLEMIRENQGASARELLVTLARELALEEEMVVATGGEQLAQLLELAIVLAAHGSETG
jgi:hypothetical protein